MKKASNLNYRIVAWPFDGQTAIGVVDGTGYVIYAVNYRMDSNVKEGDTWLSDTLYTNDIPEEDWDLVREASVNEKLLLLGALTRENSYDSLDKLILDHMGLYK